MAIIISFEVNMANFCPSCFGFMEEAFPQVRPSRTYQSDIWRKMLFSLLSSIV